MYVSYIGQGTDTSGAGDRDASNGLTAGQVCKEPGLQLVSCMVAVGKSSFGASFETLLEVSTIEGVRRLAPLFAVLPLLLRRDGPSTP